MRAAPTTPGVPCCSALHKHAAARRTFMGKSDQAVKVCWDERVQEQAFSPHAPRGISERTEDAQLVGGLSPRLQSEPKPPSDSPQIRAASCGDTDRVSARSIKSQGVGGTESRIVPVVPRSGVGERVASSDCERRLLGGCAGVRACCPALLPRKVKATV